MKQDSYWAKSEKADTFAEHLVKVFTPNTKEIGPGEEVAVFGCRESTESQTTETTRLTKGEVRAAIFKYLNVKKAMIG